MTDSELEIPRHIDLHGVNFETVYSLYSETTSTPTLWVWTVLMMTRHHQTHTGVVNVK